MKNEELWEPPKLYLRQPATQIKEASGGINDNWSTALSVDFEKCKLDIFFKFKTKFWGGLKNWKVKNFEREPPKYC